MYFTQIQKSYLFKTLQKYIPQRYMVCKDKLTFLSIDPYFQSDFPIVYFDRMEYQYKCKDIGKISGYFNLHKTLTKFDFYGFFYQNKKRIWFSPILLTIQNDQKNDIIILIEQLNDMLLNENIVDIKRYYQNTPLMYRSLKTVWEFVFNELRFYYKESLDAVLLQSNDVYYSTKTIFDNICENSIIMNRFVSVKNTNQIQNVIFKLSSLITQNKLKNLSFLFLDKLLCGQYNKYEYLDLVNFIEKTVFTFSAYDIFSVSFYLSKYDISINNYFNFDFDSYLQKILSKRKFYFLVLNEKIIDILTNMMFSNFTSFRYHPDKKVTNEHPEISKLTNLIHKLTYILLNSNQLQKGEKIEEIIKNDNFDLFIVTNQCIYYVDLVLMFMFSRFIL